MGDRQGSWAVKRVCVGGLRGKADRPRRVCVEGGLKGKAPVLTSSRSLIASAFFSPSRSPNTFDCSVADLVAFVRMCVRPCVRYVCMRACVRVREFGYACAQVCL